MPKELKINLSNATLAEILESKNCAPTKEGFIRFLAIEYLYKGDSIREAARRISVSVRTIQRWLNAYNNQGLDGLAIKGKSGRPRRIPLDKFKREYVPLILDESKDFWSAVKFHGYLRTECLEELGYSTLVKYLHESNLSLVKGRPYNIKQDPEKREQFIAELKRKHADNTSEIWFADEAGFEGDPRPMSRWVTKGTKHKIKRSHEHLRFNAVGAVCPQSGEFFALTVPYNDSQVFQIFINELAKSTDGRKINLVLDNASWHKVNLDWHNIEPLFLPAYSPDFNPIENIWKLLKANFFNNWHAKNLDLLVSRICSALDWLIHKPEQVKKTASMQYLLR